MSWLPSRIASKPHTSSWDLLRYEIGLAVYLALHGALAVAFLLRGIKIRDIYTISRSLFQLLEGIAISSVFAATYSVRNPRHPSFGYGKRRVSVLIAFLLVLLVTTDATLRVFWALKATVYNQKMYLKRTYNLVYSEVAVGILGCITFRTFSALPVPFSVFSLWRSLCKDRKRRLSDPLTRDQANPECRLASEAFEAIFIHALSKFLFAAVAVSTAVMLQSARFAAAAEAIIATVIARLVVSALQRFANILLQGVPKHLISSIKSQLQHVEAMEGVFQCSNVHFWKEGGGACVGTLSAKVKTDVDQQGVLEDITGAFSGIADELTIQIDPVARHDEDLVRWQGSKDSRSNSLTLEEGSYRSDATFLNV